MDVSIAVSLIRGQMGAVVERAVNGAVETVLAEMLKVVGVKFEELKAQVATLKKDMTALQKEKALKEKENDKIRAMLRYTELKLKYYRQGVEEEMQQIRIQPNTHQTPRGNPTVSPTEAALSSGSVQAKTALDGALARTSQGTSSSQGRSRPVVSVSYQSPDGCVASGSSPLVGCELSDLILSPPMDLEGLAALPGVSVTHSRQAEGMENIPEGLSCPADRGTATHSKEEEEEDDCEWTISLQPHTETVDTAPGPSSAPGPSAALGPQSPDRSIQADSSTLPSRTPPTQVKQEDSQEEEVICIKEEPEEQEVMATLLLDCEVMQGHLLGSEGQRSPTEWSGLLAGQRHLPEHMAALSSAGPSSYSVPEQQPSVPSVPPSSPSTVPYPPQTPANWIATFQVPWEKMAPTLRHAIVMKRRAVQSDRLQMIRVIVDVIREHCPNPTRAECTQIAKNIVAQYPQTFADVTDEGHLLGSGYTSLLNQIKTRVEHVNRNNTFSRIRRPKRTNRNDDNACQPKMIRSPVHGYGCINWQPDNLPEGETVDSLEVKRQMMVALYRNEGPGGAERAMVDNLMEVTYLKQRELINSSPTLRIHDVLQEWPFLSHKRWLCSHFEKLTGIDIVSRLTEALLSKGRRVINYFQQQRLKWRAGIQSLLTEMENDTRGLQDRDLMATSAVLLLMSYFREEIDSLFLLADVTATQADVETHLTLPDTPRLIMLGHSIMTASRWMLSVEGSVVVTLDSSDSFAMALALLFSTYYIFNMEYQEAAACTLELVQRFLVRISPEHGKKCSARKGVSKRTGRLVQRKVTAINPHVNTFIRSLMEFEWKTSN
ncbi:uncharacterized protein ACJ7VT_014482 isoform 2-T2 [Polymixia lowei]